MPKLAWYSDIRPENESTCFSRLMSLNSRVKQLSFFNLLLNERIIRGVVRAQKKMTLLIVVLINHCINKLEISETIYPCGDQYGCLKFINQIYKWVWTRLQKSFHGNLPCSVQCVKWSPCTISHNQTGTKQEHIRRSFMLNNLCLIQQLREQELYFFQQVNSGQIK